MPFKFRDKCKEEKFKYAERMRRKPTPAEAFLWERLRLKRLDGFRFRQQAVILGYIADFYCPQAKLVIELDGECHADRRAYDAIRQNRMAKFGFKTIRFSNAMVLMDWDGVLEKIRNALRSQQQDLGNRKNANVRPCKAANRALARTKDCATGTGQKAHFSNPV